MAFTMRFCKKRPERAFCLSVVFFCLLAFSGGAARAADVELTGVRLEARAAADKETQPENLELFAQARLDVSERLEDVVRKGIPLTFVWEFTLERPRWYWKNEILARKRQVWKLSYHALTQQYRLTSDSLHQTFPTLSSALFIIARLRGWAVAENTLPTGVPLTARLRFSLDGTQLPTLFQVVSSVGNKEWNLDSGWISWQIELPVSAEKAAP